MLEKLFRPKEVERFDFLHRVQDLSPATRNAARQHIDGQVFA